MTMLLGVIALFALFSLVLSVREGMAMVRLSPASKGLGRFFLLGWVQFGTLERKISAEALPHLAIYKRTVTAFIVLVALGMALSAYFKSLGG